ncbi:SAF domain-containing protein [Salinispora arenicola]|uniref:SAF domain-containing protein n=1 Tax=Salinispora arenicola TaxID=168697 RepID=UPI000363DA01|nr:SAF domain-containing protein [Salinispora arenicola]
MVLGVLLVLSTVVVFWQTDLRVNADQSYLSVARPVPAGQVIADADLRVVRVANASGLALVPADQRSQVVGRTTATPLAAGSLLTSEQVGPAAWPPSGEAVIALPVKPGRAPVGLAPGARVIVLVVPPTTAGQPVPPPDSNAAPSGTSGVQRAIATLVSAEAGEDQVGSQLVTLLLAADPAEAIASATGDVSLVHLGPEG